MECSASLAIAKFRNIPIIQFLFGADNLDATEWEQRDLTDYGFQSANKYILLALELAIAFGKEEYKWVSRSPIGCIVQLAEIKPE